MAEFSTYTEMAEKTPTIAAEAFLGKMTEKDRDTVALVLDSSQWYDKDIATFKESVLIEGKWGRFWLVQNRTAARKLKPEEPVVTLTGLKALGRGLVRVLGK